MSNTPQIRFAGFTEDWNPRKLSDVCGAFEYGLNAAAKEYDGINKYIRITDIDDVSREYSTVDVTSPNICLDGMSKYLLSNGDIVFARTGASVGKTYIYKEKDGVVYFAGFLIRAKVDQWNDAEFIFQNTLTSNYKKYIYVTSQRSGQPGVNAQEYGEYKFFSPSKIEQIKIGKYLREIDDLLCLYQRKYEKLVFLKAACLDKMFPKSGCDLPEVRFEGFIEKWKPYKIKEVADRYDNLRIPVAANLRVPGTTPYYGANGIQDYVDGFTHEGEFVLVAEDGANDLKNYPVQYVQGKIWVNNHAHVLQSKPGIANNPFLAYAINRANIESFLVGGGRAKLNAETLMDIKIVMPGVEEQQKIGLYLNRVETLITLQKRKVEKLKQLKQSMIHNMLV